VADKKKTAVPSHRMHIFYTGRVQGVGFRHTAEGIAHDEGVLGFVKNLPDGRVEIVAEGTKEKLEEFTALIRQSAVGRHITKTDLRWEDPTGEFTDFQLEFHF
jgi:acylphosphatase